jgi:hypothetical protein
VWTDDGGDEPGVAPIAAVLAHGGEAVLQHVRALPCAAGSLVQFSHRLLHWGSAALDGPAAAWRSPPEPPRIAFSFASVDDTFEPPFLPRDVLPLPPVATRTALVCALALLYTQTAPPSPTRRALFWDVVASDPAAFEPAFYAMIARNADDDDAGAAQAGGMYGGADAPAAAAADGPPKAPSYSPPAVPATPATSVATATGAAATDGTYLMFPPGPKLEAKLAALARKHAEGVLTTEQYEKATRDVRTARLIDPAHAPLRRKAEA